MSRAIRETRLINRLYRPVVRDEWRADINLASARGWRPRPLLSLHAVLPRTSSCLTFMTLSRQATHDCPYQRIDKHRDIVPAHRP